MRHLAIFLFIYLSISCAIVSNTNMNLSFLNGTWTPFKQEIGGTSLPESAFKKQKLIIYDSTYTVIAESIDKGLVKCHDDKMDIYGREGINAGKHFTAIYKYENEQLTICYNLDGNSYPESFETKSKPSLFLSAFKKEMVK